MGKNILKGTKPRGLVNFATIDIVSLDYKACSTNNVSILCMTNGDDSKCRFYETDENGHIECAHKDGGECYCRKARKAALSDAEHRLDMVSQTLDYEDKQLFGDDDE